MIRVRFAPSPTGSLHVGSLRTALYNEMYARSRGGVFILRIEDTDRTRLVKDGVANIVRTLKWAGLVPDEGPYLDDDGIIRERGSYGPYVQSERTEIYRQHVEKLLASGDAYRCFCTTERLEKMREQQASEGGRTMYDGHCCGLDDESTKALLADGVPFVVRMRIPKTGVTAWDDLIRGRVEFANDQIDEQVLMKSDGFPTYHLANVVDDHLMEITHVIRGEEWCSSTPKHLLLYKAFGWEPPRFSHMPLLLNPDRSKLSKRQGDVAVEDYRDKGYLQETLLNFIAIIGWNPSGEREIYSHEELSRVFDVAELNCAGSIFDLRKLDWMNGEYIKAMPAEELAARTLPFFEKAGLVRAESGKMINVRTGKAVAPDFLAKAVALEKERAKTLAEIPEALSFIFQDNLPLDAKLIAWKKSTPEITKERLAGLIEHLEGADEELFKDAKKIETDVVAFVVANGWTNAETLWPMRYALTGLTASPGPFEVAAVLGKSATLDRLKQALSLL